MAPAAAAGTASNWLSFSLSPMEMMATSHHHLHHDHHDQTPQILHTPVSNPSSHYFLDPIYTTGSFSYCLNHVNFINLKGF